MGLLDNVDIQLERIKNISNSLKTFKKTKLRNLDPVKTTPKKYFKQKRVKLGKAYYKKIRKGRRARVRTRCPKQYKLYIESKFWEQRKNKYYQTHKRICSACGSSNHIDLHHIVYGNFGSELDEHLTPFCRECHDEFHATYKTKRNMTKITSDFITRKQEFLSFPVL